MKRYLSCFIFLAFSCCIWAQDDIESLAIDDIELDGFENVWIQSQLMPIVNQGEASSCERIGRPKGGNVNFLNYVQKYWMRILQVMVDKYPIEMLNKQGNRYLILTRFIVDTDGNVTVTSIYGGKMLGYDMIIAQKLFDDYKKWRPSECSGISTSMQFVLKVELSL